MQLAALRNQIFRSRVFGLAAMVLGVAAWWYNQHQASTHGEFSIKLCIFGPLGLAGGLLILVRPEWAQPWRPDSTRGQKAAMTAVFSFMMVASGVDFFRLRHEILHGAPQKKVIPWTVDMGRPVMPASLSTPAVPLAIMFLGREYRLGSFNERHNARWEFVTGGETVENWTTLLTVVDRPDARTREELDRLAEGILTAYRSRGARILAAKTLAPNPETVFNYIVAAFDERAEQRYELDFVKIQPGIRNAVIAIYGVRVAGNREYAAQAGAFLDAHSSEVGRALEGLVLPEVSALPRREF